MTVIDQEKVRQIFTNEGEQLQRIHDILQPDVVSMVNMFYAELLGHPDAELFLDSELVAKRLTGALQVWIRDLFKPRAVSEIDAFLERQRFIGQVHARINVPIHLVMEGVRVLRREMSESMMRADIDRRHLVGSLVLINEMLDHVISLLNESYMSGLITNERNMQSLRMQTPPLMLAMECEKLRSSLFDWARTLLSVLYQTDEPKPGQWQPLSRSEFGLWAVHKAGFLFHSKGEIDELHHLIGQVDDATIWAAQVRKSGVTGDFPIAVQMINDHISQVAWIMASLIQQTLEMEHGRDALTRILNRRYLETIMQNETAISMQHNRPFAALLLDIDFFKRVNDTYGHDAGDHVLRQFAEVLTECVRVNDYVFRYGGEEFLVVLGDVDTEQALQLAQKIRESIEERPMSLGEGMQKIRITCSIGCALHNGHPDYQLAITAADEALYKAKDSGRNKVVVA